VHPRPKLRSKISKSGYLFRFICVRVCVCVSIFRPAAHVLMTRVLVIPKEYRTPGGVSPWVSI
jgi:hypothetical protein